MAQIRRIFVKRSQKALPDLTRPQLERHPLYGMWPPQKEAIDKGIFREKTFEIKKPITKKVEVSPGVFEEQIVEHKVVDTHTFIPSMVIASKTGTGKTDLGELAILKHILEGRGKGMYLVPYRAIAREKEGSFRKKWGKLRKLKEFGGAQIQITKQYLDVEQLAKTPDYSQVDWIISTNEKADALIRRGNPFMRQLSVLIVDEGDFIADKTRGATLEAIITRIKLMYKKVQIIFLSATIPETSVNSLAYWINLRSGMKDVIATELKRQIKQYYVLQHWRPVKLQYGVFFDGSLYHVQCKPKRVPSIIQVRQEYSQAESNIALDTLRRHGQVLIFRNSRRNAEASAKRLQKIVSQKRLLTPTEKRKLARIRIHRDDEPTAAEEELERIIKGGIAYHHAGVRSEVLEKIEANFDKGLIKAVSSTTTLARGINLPARTVIIGDMERPGGRKGREEDYILAREYHQFLGRAGRFGKEDVGYGYSIAFSGPALKKRIQNYVCAPSELIISQMGTEQALRKHLLATVIIKETASLLDLKAFIANTYLARTEVLGAGFEQIFMESVSFLEREGFIYKDEENAYRGTELGKKTSNLLLDPVSVVYLRDAAEEFAQEEEIDEIGFLHLISFVENNGYTSSSWTQLYRGWPLTDEVIEAHEKNPETAIEMTPEGGMPSMEAVLDSDFYQLYVDAPNRYRDDEKDDFTYYLQSLYTSLMLRDWINEIDEDLICKKYVRVQPGDIFRKHYVIQRIAAIYGVLDGLFESGIRSFTTKMFWRLLKGVKEELISLAQIPDIGRKRARILYDAGYVDRSTLAAAIQDPTQFNTIANLIPKKTADRIRTRLRRPEVIKKVKKQDEEIRRGVLPVPTGVVLDELIGFEATRDEYYNNVLELMVELTEESLPKVEVKYSALYERAAEKLNMTESEVERVVKLINEDGKMWGPSPGTFTLFEDIYKKLIEEREKRKK